MKEEIGQVISCCCTTNEDASCCGDTKTEATEKRQIVIDFLYLDLSACTRCQGTDQILDEAISEVSNVLELTGVEVNVNKVNVISEELAVQYQFMTSPTIRINGRDIQMDAKESNCESCGDLCGDEVDCRVWVYNGVEYTEPPKAMVVEAILKAVYGNAAEAAPDEAYVLPENLTKFYAGLAKNNTPSS